MHLLGRDRARVLGAGAAAAAAAGGGGHVQRRSRQPPDSMRGGFRHRGTAAGKEECMEGRLQAL